MYEEDIKLARKIISIVCGAIIGLIIAICLIRCFYSVDETHSAVITNFGVPRLVEEKGLQTKAPWEKKTLVDTTVHSFMIGYYEDENGSYHEIPAESIMITSDFNLLDIDFDIQYRVSDPIKYLYASNDPQLILKNIAMSSIRSVVSAYPVDSAITTGKTAIQAAVKQMIIDELNESDIGIALVDAVIQDVEPPTAEVNNAFKEVETAKQGRESAINEANAYKNEQIPTAEANADKVSQTAEATKTARINEANGKVAALNAEYEEYKKFPLITKQRMFYEAMSEVLPNLRIVIDNEGDGVYKHFNLSDVNNMINASTPVVDNTNGGE